MTTERERQKALIGELASAVIDGPDAVTWSMLKEAATAIKSLHESEDRLRAEIADLRANRELGNAALARERDAAEAMLQSLQNRFEAVTAENAALTTRLDRIRDWATRGRQFNLYAEAVGHIFAELDEDRVVEEPGPARKALDALFGNPLENFPAVEEPCPHKHVNQDATGHTECRDCGAVVVQGQEQSLFGHEFLSDYEGAMCSRCHRVSREELKARGYLAPCTAAAVEKPCPTQSSFNRVPLFCVLPEGHSGGCYCCYVQERAEAARVSEVTGRADQT